MEKILDSLSVENQDYETQAKMVKSLASKIGVTTEKVKIHWNI